MKVLVLTGGIGSGKSAVAAILRKRGVPVWDSDSEAKKLYTPSMVSRLEQEFGTRLSLPDGSLDTKALAAIVFSNPELLKRLEDILYPELKERFLAWASAQDSEVVVMESAIVLSKPAFEGMWDGVILVTAPKALRAARAAERDGVSKVSVLRRMKNQSVPGKADVIIRNTGTPQELETAVQTRLFGKNGYICKILNDKI